MTRRALDAWHEAAHVVAGAHYGDRTAGVYIPMRDVNGQVLVSKHGYQWPGQTHATTFSALFQHEDLVTLLEDAVSHFAGVVAECVLAGWKLPELPEHALCDHARGVACITEFENTLRGWANPIHGSQTAERSARKEKAAFEKAVGMRYREAMRSAKSLVGQHYRTIDAVAAILVCHGQNGGMWWSDAHHKWLLGEMRKPARGRDSAKRKPWRKRPRWLAIPASQMSPADFTFLRREVNAMDPRQR